MNDSACEFLPKDSLACLFISLNEYFFSQAYSNGEFLPKDSLFAISFG